MKKKFTRRTFLGGLIASAWLPRFAFAAPPENFADDRDILVCVFQRGGADGLNVVVPYGDSRYHDNRLTLGIPEPGGAEGAALELDDFFGLHPSMAPMKELFDDGALAPIHAVGSHDDTRSHFDAMDFMERGTPGQKSLDSGWIGRHLGSFTSDNDSPFRALGFGGMLQTSLRGPIPATALASIADFHLGGDRSTELTEFQNNLEKLYKGNQWLDLEGQGTFDAIEMLQTADPLKYTPDNGAQYPQSEFGLALQQVGQMIKAEVGMEVACVDIGGWDTHQGQGNSTGFLANLLEDFAIGLNAFYEDMGDRMKCITVVTMSEFGRRVKENASGGTDHGHGNVMFLMGGGINGGTVWGKWPGLAPEQLNGPGDLEITTDFRTVLGEVVEKRLLNSNLNEVFPGFGNGNFLGVCQTAG